MRCFVAVWPAPAVLDALAGLARPPVDGLHWTTPGQWHVTMRFFGELGPEDAENAGAALAGVVASWPGPFDAEGGPGTRFLGAGLVIWPVEGLTGAALAVERATADIGQPVPERPFVGHITIARGRRGTDLRHNRHLLQPLSALWTVSSVSLVESELHAAGAIYRDIETFSVAH